MGRASCQHASPKHSSGLYKRADLKWSDFIQAYINMGTRASSAQFMSDQIMSDKVIYFSLSVIERDSFGMQFLGKVFFVPTIVHVEKMCIYCHLTLIAKKLNLILASKGLLKKDVRSRGGSPKRTFT